MWFGMEPHEPVFATRNGTLRNRFNITRQILHPAIARANGLLVEAGLGSIEGVTNHSLRRTFACCSTRQAPRRPT